MSLIRKAFIQHFFLELLADTQYVLLKHIEPSVFDVKESSDLDLLFLKSDVDKMVKAIKVYPKLTKLNVVKKQSMSQLYLYFEDGGFLQLDFLYQLIRKNLVYLDAKDVFANRIKNKEGVYLTSEQHLFEHVILFNYLNFAGLKEKYIQYFGNLPTERQQTLFTNFNQKYNTDISEISYLSTFHGSFRNKILAKLAQSSANSATAKIGSTVTYFLDQTSEIMSKKGITITFSGVDGAGKSTILDKTKTLLTDKYRQKVVMLRHRPQILPILSAYKYGKEAAEKKAAETMPRTGGNKSSIGSLVRFVYYLTDYIFGQFYIYFKYNRRGYVVLYDRYYFDFIVDHKRSNIVLPSWIPRFFYRFVFKQDLNFFLYAPPEVILKRKQELPSEEITKLTKGYKGLFEDLTKEGARAKYIPIKNIVLEETMDTIEQAIAAKL